MNELKMILRLRQKLLFCYTCEWFFKVLKITLLALVLMAKDQKEMIPIQLAKRHTKRKLFQSSVRLKIFTIIFVGMKYSTCFARRKRFISTTATFVPSNRGHPIIER